jgi:hypothetical protein
MKFAIAIFVFSLSLAASASEAYLITCKSDLMTLNLKKKLTSDGEVNGWKHYFAEIDYTIYRESNKTGTVNAYISWRKDSRPGYNGLDISLMDKAHLELRRMGLEGGRMSFGSIDSRQEIKGSFSAQWKPHDESEDVPEFPQEDVNMTCEMLDSALPL